MNKLMSVIKRLWRDEEGAAAVEYGLLVALIAGVIIVAVTSLGTNVKAAFCVVVNALNIPAVTGATNAGC